MAGLAAVILAAGKGTRMKSATPKVLHPLAGRFMIDYPVQIAKALGADPIVVVVGHEGERIRTALESEDLLFVSQEPQLGTGHALMFAKEALKDHTGEILILCGDVPLLGVDTVRGLVARHRALDANITALVGRLEEPKGYGRILRDERGRILGVVEEKDATDEERAIEEVNAGTYCAESKTLFRVVDELETDNAQGEYYLTDVIARFAPDGVASYEVAGEEEILGINDREDLAAVEQILRERIRGHWMREGVTMQDPRTTYIDATVRIGADTVLGPNVVLLGDTQVGGNCRIDTGCVLEDSTIHDGAKVRPFSVIQKSIASSGATIGPFAHLRPGSEIGPDARIGNFVEVKNAIVGRRSKAAHLSYLGDTQVGDDVNIGAGTITCNYDGFAKHPTVIEDGVFVGSDTQFVAPVRVGRNAIVGAGSTITKNVPPEALAVSRVKQVNLKGKARRRSRKG